MTASLFHAHLWGTREHKDATLRETNIPAPAKPLAGLTLHTMPREEPPR